MPAFSSYRSFWSSFVLMCCLALSHFSEAQLIEPPVSLIVPKVKRKDATDPQRLIAALIDGKSGEKERFDAIFSWVVNNIRYNQKQYNSGKAGKAIPIKRILKRRNAICTDYARLMDTLCGLAGIQNTSVNGYIKEIIFDVNDSLYIDNHTWNAVKLNGKWFLYDATWSAGGKMFDYTRFGKWRIRQLDQWMTHARSATRVLQTKKKKNVFCGIPGGKILDSVEVSYLPFPYNFMYRVVGYFPFRLKEKYQTITNTAYYLTQPEVFVLDHFPDDPIWSLSTTVRTIDDFRTDSTYYYGIHHYFKEQEREGRTCIACDDFLSLDEVEREKYLITVTREAIPLNHFVPGMSELNLAEIYLKRFIKEEDSLQKMRLFDTTLIHLNGGKAEFRACRGPVARDHKFHAAKNKAKQDQALRENKEHRRATDKLFAAISLRNKKIRSMDIKSRTFAKQYKRDYSAFQRSFSLRTAGVMKEEKVKLLQGDLQNMRRSSDSLTAIIAVTRDSLLIHTVRLWKNVLVERKVVDPIVAAFVQDGFARGSSQMDSYDREVRQLRAVIDEKERLLLSRVDEHILRLADTTYAEFITLNRLIRQRNKYNRSAAKLMSTLQSAGKFSADSTRAFRERQLELMKEDACWNVDQQGLFVAVSANFVSFYSQSKRFNRIIEKNSAVERERYAIIQKHIERNRKRVLDAVATNLEVITRLRKVAYLHRTEFIRKWKKEHTN